jgi:hypothetical protein
LIKANYSEYNGKQISLVIALQKQADNLNKAAKDFLIGMQKWSLSLTKFLDSAI